MGHTSDNNNAISVVALVISLVALLATSGQLLQQYFATADGYRRCQTSVMGPWGRKTKLKWRWRQFRFETIYYVPSISVSLASEVKLMEFNRKSAAHVAQMAENGSAYYSSSTPDLHKTHVISGSPVPDHWWQSPASRHKEELEGGGEMVCWVELLERLRMAQAQLNGIYWPPAILESLRESTGAKHTIYQMPTIQCIKIHERSWDFMPPDVVRPLCLTTVSDIAILAVRLGMEWKEFDPAQGNLRAEGHGHLITSRMVRSVGIVAEYRVTDSIAHTARRISDLLQKSYLPVLGISDLLFGIVPGNVHLECWDRSIGSIETVNNYLEALEIDYDGSSLTQALEMHVAKNRGWLSGFNDIIPLTAPKMASVSSLLNNLPMPNTFHPGLLRTQRGLLAFCQELRTYAATRNSPQIVKVLSWVTVLENEWGPQWYAKDSEWGTAQTLRSRRVKSPTPLPPSPSPPPPTPPTPTTKNTSPNTPPDKDYQSTIMDYFDLAEDYLLHFNASPDLPSEKLPYSKLVDEHIKMAIQTFNHGDDSADDEAEKAYLDAYPDPSFPFSLHQHRRFLERRMRSYWRYLSRLTLNVAETTGREEGEIADAWVTMVFRAFCWHHCHRLVPSKFVLPAEWHESKLPVYIG